MAVFPPTRMDDDLVRELEAFLSDNDFPSLYKSYSWRNDTHSAGFPDIHRLEEQIGSHAKVSRVTLDDIVGIVCWGGSNSPITIRCPDSLVKFNTMFRTIVPPDNRRVSDDPHLMAMLLDKAVSGIGPTNVSKVLRFAIPEKYGAVDSRCVRVFGLGDPAANAHDWIKLQAREDTPNRWNIQQHKWAEKYILWIDILGRLAQSLNEDRVRCPHPERFVKAGLRKRGSWTCADVEMALFAYASEVIESNGCLSIR